MVTGWFYSDTPLFPNSALPNATSLALTLPYNVACDFPYYQLGYDMRTDLTHGSPPLILPRVPTPTSPLPQDYNLEHPTGWVLLTLAFGGFPLCLPRQNIPSPLPSFTPVLPPCPTLATVNSSPTCAQDVSQAVPYLAC